VADKERELAKAQAEKNASLESLVRATAAATKEAGKLVSCSAWVYCSFIRPLISHLAPRPGHARSMVRVIVTDVAWIGGDFGLQNEQHEATKKALQEAQQQATQLQGELASLQAEFASACSAKGELLEEKGRLETRVSPQAGSKCLYDAAATLSSLVLGLLCV
jgi:hypothetical protein